jgi:predicted DCC family thiol-disulfide oxidoreductase YuxK
VSAGGPPGSPAAPAQGKESSAAGEGRLTVLYDGRCRVCTRVAGRLAGLDTGRRLRLVPLQRAAVDRPEVQRLRAQRDLRRALHVIDEEGRWASGGEAVIRTLECLPRLRPLASVARLPGVARLVETAYRLVADHRARLAWLAGDFPLPVTTSDPRLAAPRPPGAGEEPPGG